MSVNDDDDYKIKVQFDGYAKYWKEKSDFGPIYFKCDRCEFKSDFEGEVLIHLRDVHKSKELLEYKTPKQPKDYQATK